MAVNLGQSKIKMAKLAGAQVYPHDSVYDVAYGQGKVTHVENYAFYVSFGCQGRPRKYKEDGSTGKSPVGRTLYWHKPLIIEFPRDECNALRMRRAVMDMLPILEGLTRVKDCFEEKPCCEEPDCGC